MKEKYIIKDWANNHCFSDKIFNSYEDGWDFLYSKFPVIDGDDREDELGEFYVLPINN
jgi:hypothetical protein